jgi:hypothetical protein
MGEYEDIYILEGIIIGAGKFQRLPILPSGQRGTPLSY